MLCFGCQMPGCTLFDSVSCRCLRQSYYQPRTPLLCPLCLGLVSPSRNALFLASNNLLFLPLHPHAIQRAPGTMCRLLEWVFTAVEMSRARRGDSTLRSPESGPTWLSSGRLEAQAPSRAHASGIGDVALGQQVRTNVVHHRSVRDGSDTGPVLASHPQRQLEQACGSAIPWGSGSLFGTSGSHSFAIGSFWPGCEFVLPR